MLLACKPVARRQEPCVSGKHSILEMGKKTNSRLLHHRRINYCACLSGQSLAWHMPATCRWRIVRRRRILTARTSFSCRGITPRRRRGHARLCIVTHPLLLPGFTHAPCVRACTCGSVLKMMISAPYVFDEGISSVKPTAAVSFLFLKKICHLFSMAEVWWKTKCYRLLAA